MSALMRFWAILLIVSFGIEGAVYAHCLCVSGKKADADVSIGRGRKKKEGTEQELVGCVIDVENIADDYNDVHFCVTFYNGKIEHPDGPVTGSFVAPAGNNFNLFDHVVVPEPNSTWTRVETTINWTRDGVFVACNEQSFERK